MRRAGRFQTIAALCAVSCLAQSYDLMIRQGRIKPLISRVFPLQEAAAAHRAFEAGEIVGRAVLVC